MGKVYLARPNRYGSTEAPLVEQNALWLETKTGETLGYLVISPTIGSGGRDGVAATREDAEKLIQVFKERYSWLEYEIEERDTEEDVVCEPYTGPVSFGSSRE
jgi:hypothetical protein